MKVLIVYFYQKMYLKSSTVSNVKFEKRWQTYLAIVIFGTHVTAPGRILNEVIKQPHVRLL